MERHKIAIIIPAFNEEITISKIIKESKQYGIPIVINDGSEDLTKETSLNSGAYVVNHTTNLGYESSLNTGFEYAKKMGCKYIITIDADGQLPIKKIPVFIKKLNQGADVVIGRRNKKQRISEYIFSFFSSFKWGISDPLCGLKAYKIDLYNQLGAFHSFNSVGTQLAIFASKNKNNIKEVPIKIRKRKGKSRFGGSFKGNYKIIMALYINIKKYG
jgi:glycosyltransferase involved in cell wall biosynthesis